MYNENTLGSLSRQAVKASIEPRERNDKVINNCDKCNELEIRYCINTETYII